LLGVSLAVSLTSSGVTAASGALSRQPSGNDQTLDSEPLAHREALRRVTREDRLRELQKANGSQKGRSCRVAVVPQWTSSSRNLRLVRAATPGTLIAHGPPLVERVGVTRHVEEGRCPILVRHSTFCGAARTRSNPASSGMAVDGHRGGRNAGRGPFGSRLVRV